MVILRPNLMFPTDVVFGPFSCLITENIMILFQKFLPTGVGEAAKLSNGSDADSEIQDKVSKPCSMPVKMHLLVRPTKSLLMIKCIMLFIF